MSKIKITFLMIAAIMLTFVSCTAPVPEQNTFTVGDVTFTMIPVQGGSFLMGAEYRGESSLNYDADMEDDEQPVHKVTLSDYAVGETEVTQSLWQAVMGNSIQDQAALAASQYFTPSIDGEGDDYPMYYVSWDDICGVDGFLEKLNAQLSSQLGGRRFVLPTEAQWEFAAAGGQAGYNPDGSRKHKYSGSDNIEDVAWYLSNSDNTTHSVKGKIANELGLYDMSGNVWEWCSDWYASYSADDQIDPIGASSGSDRVNRGGSWFHDAVSCRVAYRAYDNPSYRSYYLGFRLALVQD